MTSAAETNPELRSRLFRLALLNIVANLSVPLAGLVDAGMLGNLKESFHWPGVALATVVFDFIYWTAGCLRMGTTGTTAQALGRGDNDDCYRVLYRSLILAILFGAAILALQWPIREGGFAALSGTTAVKEAGKEYFNARIWGAPAVMCNLALLGWYLGRTEAGTMLLITAVGGLANILFNYIFIIRMGLAAYGAGLATALAQYAMLALGLGIFFFLRRPVAWRWREVWDRSRMRALLSLNRDILIRTLFIVIAFALFINFSSVFGETTLAANGILLNLLALAAYLIDGVAFAAEPLAGILHGRGDRAGLWRLLRMSIAAGAAFAAAFLAALLLLPGVLYPLLSGHKEVIAVVRQFDYWMVPVLAAGSLAFVLDGFFLGLTAGRTLRNSLIISLILFFLPLSIAALLERDNHMLWASLALFMTARAATLGLAVKKTLAQKG